MSYRLIPVCVCGHWCDDHDDDEETGHQCLRRGCNCNGFIYSEGQTRDRYDDAMEAKYQARKDDELCNK